MFVFDRSRHIRTIYIHTDSRGKTVSFRFWFTLTANVDDDSGRHLCDTHFTDSTHTSINIYISVVVAILGVAVLAMTSTEHECQSSRPDVGRSTSVLPSINSGFRMLCNQSLRVTRSKKWPMYARPLLVMLSCFVSFSCFPIYGGYEAVRGALSRLHHLGPP